MSAGVYGQRTPGTESCGALTPAPDEFRIPTDAPVVSESVEKSTAIVDPDEFATVLLLNSCASSGWQRAKNTRTVTPCFTFNPRFRVLDSTSGTPDMFRSGGFLGSSSAADRNSHSFRIPGVQSTDFPFSECAPKRHAPTEPRCRIVSNSV